MEYEEERLNNLSYKFELEDKYIYVNKNNNKYVVKSPYLKVLKAKHEFKNKNYLIVQLDQDLDVDEQMDAFIKKIRAIDEYSKEILLNNSKNWYGKKWDIYTLDSMTRYPIDEQKGVLYMKIIINKEDKELNKSIETLEKIMENNKEVYISIKTFFKGLRWSREIFTEEWYLEDFNILEEDDQDLILENLIKNIEESNKNKEKKESLLENKKEEEYNENKEELNNKNEKLNLLENEESQLLENKELNLLKNEESNLLVNKELYLLEIEESDLLENEKSNLLEIEESKLLENEEQILLENQEENILENEELNILENENIKEINNIDYKNKQKKSKNKKNIIREDGESIISTTSSKIKKRFILNGKIIK